MYIGIVVSVGTLVGSGCKPNLGLSILATRIVTVGFQPVRERLQRGGQPARVREAATPYQVLSQFSERVAESYAEGRGVLLGVLQALEDAEAETESPLV